MKPPKVVDAFTQDAALMVAGVVSVDELAGAYGLSVPDVLERIELAAGAIELEVLAARLDGREVEARATQLLGDFLTNLEQLCRRGELSDTNMLRAVDILHRVSGQPERRAARIRRDASLVSDTPQATIQIFLGDGAPPLVIPSTPRLSGDCAEVIE